ncbi:tumor protein p53-inducible nuclear protein 2-like [Oscarella lobularis]|uniref:tumor protein p53-inducible nuclear protein 2-like n=1 Tax=Oscarella lobularis TaxID=121494 RepID=UPI003313EC8A
MLGGIIDYLLGPGETSTSLDPVETQRKREDDTIDLTETTEDDFIVVTDSTKTKGRRGDDEEWVVVDTWQRKESDDEEDNGWVVAPPECFRRAETTTGTNVVESTDMENLLIEHPSMSVYVMRAPVVRRRSTSAARLSRSDHDERRVARARLAHALGAVPSNRNVRKTDAAPTRCCQAKKVRAASKLGNLVHQRWSSSKQKKVVRQKIVCPRKSY